MSRSDAARRAKGQITGSLGPARATFQALMAEARSKSHQGLVKRLEEVSSEAPNREASARMQRQTLPSDLDGSLGHVAAKRRLKDLVLPVPIVEDIRDFLHEQSQIGLLRSHSLEPRHKLLLVGPPGTGKTSLAEVIASELKLPFFVVRYDGLIASYLGETASRLRKLTDFVAERPCVVFFDEFDTLGKERGDQQETGEIKRVVSSLLLQMDALPSHCVVVCATNHPELLDRAVWRRFDLRLDVPLPGETQIREWLGRLSDDHPEKMRVDTDDFVSPLLGMNFSDIEAFTLDIRRRIVLSNGDINLQEAATSGLRRLKERKSRMRSVDDFKTTDNPPPPRAVRPKKNEGRAPKAASKGPSS